LPCEACVFLGLFLGLPDAVAALAACSLGLRGVLLDASGRMRVTALEAASLRGALQGLRCVSFQHLVTLRVDLLTQSGSKELMRRDVEHLVANLGRCLAMDGARQLRVLSMRLATYDAKMDRLRLGGQALGALVRGLGGLARHGQLRFLELSFLPLRLAQAMQPVAPFPRLDVGDESSRSVEEAMTLFGALGSLLSLEELVLTHDDIFGTTGLELAKALAGLPRLRSLDLSRNRISRLVMKEVRAMLSQEVRIHGSELQANACVSILPDAVGTHLQL